MDAVTGSAGTLINEDPMETLKQTCTLLHEELRRVRTQLETSERTLNRERGERLTKVVTMLVNEAKGTGYGLDTDITAMWARLVDLISDDDHECWTPEREYAITATYTVKVTCYAKGTTEEEAREKFDAADISFNLSNYLRHDLDHLDIEDTDRDDLTIELN